MLFFIVWATVMGSYLYFALHVAPSALKRWAEEQGYQILERRNAGPIDWWSYSEGSGHHIYRVVLLDEEGQARRGLVRVGTPYWFCLSVSHCPVEVRWKSLGVSLQPVQPVARRTVFCFAIADLLVAILLLAAELGLLFVIVLCLDEIWDGALGLNRKLGRVPGPAARSETRRFLAQFLGLFALCLSALVTLTAGGIGMIRRKTWGYTLMWRGRLWSPSLASESSTRSPRW